MNLFKKGDSVRVKRGARFTNGVEPYSYVYDTVYTVQQVSASGKETLIGIGSVPTGWLYTENLYKAESDEITQKFAVGDKVKVNYGAKTYNGGSLALFVYTMYTRLCRQARVTERTISLSVRAGRSLQR